MIILIIICAVILLLGAMLADLEDDFNYLVFAMIICLFVAIGYKTYKLDDYLTSEVKVYAKEIQSKGYLSNSIKEKIKNDISDNGGDQDDVKIESNSKNDRKTYIFIKLNYSYWGVDKLNKGYFEVLPKK